MKKFEHVRGGGLMEELVLRPCTDGVSRLGSVQRGPYLLEEGACVMRSNASWVMGTWEPPSHCGQTDMTENIPSHNFVGGLWWKLELDFMAFAMCVKRK